MEESHSLGWVHLLFLHENRAASIILLPHKHLMATVLMMTWHGSIILCGWAKNCNWVVTWWKDEITTSVFTHHYTFLPAFLCCSHFEAEQRCQCGECSPSIWDSRGLPPKQLHWRLCHRELKARPYKIRNWTIYQWSSQSLTKPVLEDHAVVLPQFHSHQVEVWARKVNL